MYSCTSAVLPSKELDLVAADEGLIVDLPGPWEGGHVHVGPGVDGAQGEEPEAHAHVAVQQRVVVVVAQAAERERVLDRSG